MVITLKGDTLIVSDGLTTRQAQFATVAAARGLATRFQRNLELAAKWLRPTTPPLQPGDAPANAGQRS